MQIGRTPPKDITDWPLREQLAWKFNPNEWLGYQAFHQYINAGLNLIDEINALDPDLVVDAGCGHNRFKGHINNLIGFDQEPFPFADMHCSIEDAKFRPESVDVTLCLGSIQYGDKDLITRQLDNVVSWTKPGGFIVMRVVMNTGSDVDKWKWYEHTHYPWASKDIEEFTHKYGLHMFRPPVYDTTTKTSVSERMVWWWQKPGELKRYKIDPMDCKITEREKHE